MLNKSQITYINELEQHIARQNKYIRMLKRKYSIKRFYINGYDEYIDELEDKVVELEDKFNWWSQGLSDAGFELDYQQDEDQREINQRIIELNQMAKKRRCL